MTLEKIRASMVHDLKQLAEHYRSMAYRFGPRIAQECDSMALNYESLAEALAERKPFEAVA